MNLLNQIFGLVINLFTLGHSEINMENVLAKTILSFNPISLLQRAGMESCRPHLFNFGENALKIGFLPKGFCSNCCPTKMDSDVKFAFYNKKNRHGVTIEPYNAAGAARRAGVNPNVSTVIFIHGFSEPSPGESGLVVLEAYYSRPEDYNLILVDWSDLGAFPWYRTAVQNLKLVATLLQEFIAVFNKSGEIPIQNVHVIGFSLGAHVAGHTGKLLQRRKLRLPRITALDPAFPDISLNDRSKRISFNDAEYVDVIHTDGGIFGFPLNVGHADYYPNGGRALQPGCQPSYLVQQRLIDKVVACSHVRAWRLYAESVRNPQAFPSTRCPNFRGQSKRCDFRLDSYMGFGNNNRSKGQFFLLTKEKYPYSKTVEEQSVPFISQ